MTQDEALRASALANTKHGKPLKSSERRNVFKNFIRGKGHKKPDGKLMTYREISEALGGHVGHTTIYNWMRKDFPRVFKAMGVEIYSVSTDSHFVHKAWHDTSESIRKIQYPMLADPTGALSRALGVYIEEEGMAYRGTFLVNPEGKIKIAEIQDNNIGRNADELLRKVEAAQFVATHDGEVCPAKWKKGGATLKPSIDLVGKI